MVTSFSVGMTGFEPATTRPPDAYSTGLSYIPSSEFACETDFLFRYAPAKLYSPRFLLSNNQTTFNCLY